MNRLLLVVLLGICLVGFGLPVRAQLAPPSVVRIDIKHIGPPATSDDLVRANIRTRVGEPFLRTQADDDVRTLYATGYFYNIRVVEDRTEEGVALTYFVQGKPVLTELNIVGNQKYSRKRLNKKITSRVGEPLNERKLFSDAEAIRTYYQKEGYQGTKVKYSVTVDEATGRGTATIEITEAPRVRVVDVEFIGAQAFTQKKLRMTIKTRRWWMFSWLTGSGKLKDEQFETDKEKLADFYRAAGYIDFEIKDIQFDYKEPTRLIIRFIINEGIQYKIGSIEFKGNRLFTSEELMRVLPGKVGTIFTPKLYYNNNEAVNDKYGSKGYIDARIFARRIPNTERGTIDLVYEIDEKEQVYIEKIEIKGNNKTKDKVIRRELAVSPGEIFDMTRIKLSTNRLAGLQYFEKLDDKAEPTEVPNRRNLIIDVEEKSTGNFSLGAGFSSIDSLVGFVEVSQGNFDLFNPPYFTGGGQKVRARAQIGTKRQDLTFNFVEPWFMDRRISLGVDLYYRNLQFQSTLYNELRGGGSVSLTKALGSEFLIGRTYITPEYISIRDVSPFASQEIQSQAGGAFLTRFGASIAYDTRNSVQLPNKGQRTEFSGEFTIGEIRNYRFELRSSWYFKGLAKGHVLEIAGRSGVVDAWDNTSGVPIYDRFFLGGLYSLRGFDYREVGPKDVNGEPVGGRTYWFGTAEYSIPIIERLRFAVFYDIGMVYENAYSFSPGNRNTGVYNDNFGAGVRLNLPIGPLRIDYGIPITSDPVNENSGRLQFGVGYTREF
jgi:outer membrane protein insertion porin family